MIHGFYAVNSNNAHQNAHYKGRARMILTSVVGRSIALVCTFPMALILSMPEHTRPKMVCLPSSHGVGASVMKNCMRYMIKTPENRKVARVHVQQAAIQRIARYHRHVCARQTPRHKQSTRCEGPTWLPLVFGPLLAMLRIPAPVCFKSFVISSSNLPPYMLSPPRPVPVGSPPWIMKFLIILWNCAQASTCTFTGQVRYKMTQSFFTNTIVLPCAEFATEPHSGSRVRADTQMCFDCHACTESNTLAYNGSVIVASPSQLLKVFGRFGSVLVVELYHKAARSICTQFVT